MKYGPHSAALGNWHFISVSLLAKQDKSETFCPFFGVPVGPERQIRTPKFHDECPDDVAVWATLWGDMVAGTTRCVPSTCPCTSLAEEGQPLVTLCQCSGRCQCVRKAPKCEWKQQSEIAECWKRMVPKLVGAGVRSLSDTLSHEQWWQPCLVCDKQVLQAGGQLAMAAQVLHVTNQGQSVRIRIREGMRGRSLRRPSSAPPCG